MTLSVVNLDPAHAAKIHVGVEGSSVKTASARVITSDAMDARPDFGTADPLSPKELKDVATRSGAVLLVAPAKSVVVVKLRLVSQPGGGAKKSAE